MSETSKPPPVLRCTRRSALLAPLLAWPAAARAASATAPLTVRHALSQEQNAKVLGYEQAVLKLLLDKTVGSHGPYRLQASELVSQNRAFLQLNNGELDVFSAMTSVQREQQALPLRFCLYRGLLGVRLPIALARRAAELENDAGGQDGRGLRIGQVADWPDARILAANGWQVERLQRLGNFPEMLNRERIDLFALGATEAYPLVDALPAAPAVQVLRRWLIAYPSAFYFFVSPRQPELARRLQAGWEQVLQDGSFALMFERWAGPQLQRAQLETRRWLLLDNPELPNDTPGKDPRLWHPLVRKRLFGHSPMSPRTENPP